MPNDRRTFLKLSAGAGAVLTLGAARPGMAAAPSRAPAASPPVRGQAMRILVLGGTSFIGPHQIQYGMDRGHEISIFNRGRTNTHLFPEVEKLVGDRAISDYDSLRGKTWDVVIDNSAINPTWVRDAAQMLKDQAERYIFVSTRSVYSDVSRIPMSIEAPVWTYETAGVDPAAERLPYGLSKSLAEAEAREAFGERTTIFRPGLIIGPGDRTDRFTYWPVRIDRGGEVLAPGDGSDPVQIIDVRDFGEWLIRMAESGPNGTYNVVGPRTPRPMDQLLYGIKAATSAECTFTWVDTDFLISAGVRPYAEMPVWRPARDGSEGFARFDLSREVELGLTFRPLAQTAADTLEFHYARPAEQQDPLRAGLTAEEEREILRLWRTFSE